MKSEDSATSQPPNFSNGPGNIRVPQNLDEISTDTETESEAASDLGETFESVVWNFDQIATEKKVGDAHL